MADARFLLDANICIYILDRQSSPAVLRLQECKIGEAVTSTIVYADVMLGAVRRDGFEAARSLFEIIPVLPFEIAAADIYARLPFKRQSFDRLIAAQALASGLTVVTRNVADFQGIDGLRVEDWSQE